MYRGIDIETGEWVYGWYCFVPERKYFVGNGTKKLVPARHFIIDAEATEQCLAGCEPSIYDISGAHEVYPESIAMNTAICDKNNKPIFGSILIDDKMSKGGDIIKVANVDIVQVLWHKQTAGFNSEPEIEFCEWGWNETCADHLGRVEIIGTQWENRNDFL